MPIETVNQSFHTMNPREPHDGLSAYFDGELNPTEHQEIESHLPNSAETQRELTEIRQLSEEIRNLPQESPPPNLLSHVMQQIDKGTPTPEKIAPEKARSGSLAKPLMGVGSWMAIAVALVVLLAWIPAFWNPAGRENLDSTIATHSQKSATSDDEAESLPTPDAVPEQPGASNRPGPIHLGSEAELLAQKQHDRQARVQPEAAAPSDEPQAVIAANSLEMRAPKGQSLNFQHTETDEVGGKKRATDSQVADVLQRAEGNRDEVLVVEITVANASDSMRQLQSLLAGNQVSPKNFASPSLSSLQAPAEGGRAKEARSVPGEEGLFVQSSPTQMQKALTAFRTLQSTASVQAQTTFAFTETFLGEENTDQQNRRKMQGGFGGGRSFAQSVPRDEAKPQRETAPNEVADSQTKKLATKKAKVDAKPQAKDSAEFARPRIAAPDLTGLAVPGLQSPPAANMDKSNAFQMRVPNAVLKNLPIAKPQPAQPGEGKLSETSPRESAKEAEETSSRPLRVLFLFRESPQAPQP